MCATDAPGDVMPNAASLMPVSLRAAGSAAVASAHAATVVAVDAGDGVRLPGRDRHGGVLQREARLRPPRLQHVDEARVANAQHVAHAGVVGDAADQHAIDFILGQAAVFQRLHEGLRADLVRAALGVEVR